MDSENDCHYWMGMKDWNRIMNALKLSNLKNMRDVLQEVDANVKSKR